MRNNSLPDSVLFNEGKGPGCDNLVTNELHFPVFHLAKENKEEK